MGFGHETPRRELRAISTAQRYARSHRRANARPARSVQAPGGPVTAMPGCKGRPAGKTLKYRPVARRSHFTATVALVLGMGSTVFGTAGCLVTGDEGFTEPFKTAPRLFDPSPD